MKRPFRICLKMLGDSSWMGGVYYILNLIRALRTLPPEIQSQFQLTLFINKNDPAVFREFEGELKGIQIIKTAPGFPDWIMDQANRRFLARLPQSIARLFNIHHYDFVYPTIQNGRNSYDWGSWIPDFQHRYLPELFSAKEIVLREKAFGQLANSAPIIIFSSQICLDDFKRFYPDSTAETSVLHFVSYMQPSWFLPDPRITQKKYDLPERFFLVSNQFWKHKNYDLLIDALYTLKQDDQPIPVIVCTGKTFDYRHPHYSDEIKTKIEHYGLTQNIIMLGLIPRIDQIQLMRQSLAVIQPSLSEGWSTVVEDARSFGKSIYLSDLPVHLEQNPDYAKYFSPLDKVTLAKMLKDGNDALPVGPDLDRERVAKIMMEKRLNEFGSNFWKITQRRISG